MLIGLGRRAGVLTHTLHHPRGATLNEDMEAADDAANGCGAGLFEAENLAFWKKHDFAPREDDDEGGDAKGLLTLVEGDFKRNTNVGKKRTIEKISELTEPVRHPPS